MASKIDEKIGDLSKHILNAFKHGNNMEDSALNDIRKGCEAMCKIIIFKKKGEINGLKIINGQINEITFVVKYPEKSLDLYALIKTCNYHRWFNSLKKENTALFHKFDELRFGGNKGSHDNTDRNKNPTTDDIQYCVINFKYLVKWFWKEILNNQIPQDVLDSMAYLRIKEINVVEGSKWEELTNLSNNFVSTTQNFLIAPNKFKNLSGEQLLVLSKVNWNIIFDFDFNSKQDGLFNAFNEKTNKNLRPITIEQITQKNIMSSSKYAINWIFCNGISGIETTRVSNYKEWRSKKYISLLENAIDEYAKQSSPSHINIIILFEDVNYIEKIVEIISDKYPPSLLNFIVLTNENDKFYQITEKFDKITLIDIEIVDFIQSVDSFIESKNLNIKAIQVPAKRDDKDIFIDIESTYLSFLDKDIDVLHKTIHNTISVDVEPLNFYKGGVIQWNELANETEVRRDIETEVTEKVESYLTKQSSKGPIIELFHRPGSGGTTLSRKIGFKLKDKYPVVIINKYKKNITSQGLFDLSELTKKPILAIVESHNVNVNDLNAMIRENNASKKHIVYLYLERYYSNASVTKNKQSEVYLKDSMTSIDERERFVNKFSLNIPSKEDSIKNLSNNQPSECEVIDFSLTAFEDDFSKGKIIDYVKTYIEIGRAHV